MITSNPHTQYNVYILDPAQKILIKMEGGGFHRRPVVWHILHDLEFPLALLSRRLFLGLLWMPTVTACLCLVCLSVCLFVCFSNLDDNEFIQSIYFTIIICVKYISKCSLICEFRQSIYFAIIKWVKNILKFFFYVKESSLNGLNDLISTLKTIA